MYSREGHRICKKKNHFNDNDDAEYEIKVHNTRELNKRMSKLQTEIRFLFIRGLLPFLL